MCVCAKKYIYKNARIVIEELFLAAKPKSVRGRINK